MNIVSKKEVVSLLIGDIGIFLLSLWLTLAVRYMVLPSQTSYVEHFNSFAVLFIIWIGVFFVLGLYDKQTAILKKNMTSLIIRAQVLNTIIAVIFFYFVTFTELSPKTNLFIYLIISTVLLFSWRNYGIPLLRPKRKVACLIIGAGDYVNELALQFEKDIRYGISLVKVVDPGVLKTTDLEKIIIEDRISMVIFDSKSARVNEALSTLYAMISKVRFVELDSLYERVFDRIPLDHIDHGWFLRHASYSHRPIYDIFKRLMDLAISAFLLVVSSPLSLLAFILIKMEEVGKKSDRTSSKTIIIQERIGQNNRLIKLFKFRTMTNNDNGLIGSDSFKENKVLKVGAFLRKTRIDELPQLWNVLKGDISLIGPRPEFPMLVDRYNEAIPYYNTRHLIKPGLSGWAQIYQRNHPHPHKDGVATDTTKEKLSFDLYYIKHRSFALDINIAIKTVGTLLSFVGI